MAVTYTNAVKVARMNAVVAQIDAGAGASVLQIGTTGMASILAEFTLPDPCGTVAGAGVLTFDTTPVLNDASANNTGTAAEARFRNGDGTDVITGLTVTLAGGGGDIILDSLSITTGQSVTISSATITHA